MCDEVLAGGGRCGTFWAFEQYSGFYPDYLYAGKALVVAMIVFVRRPDLITAGSSDATVTSNSSSSSSSSTRSLSSSSASSSSLSSSSSSSTTGWYVPSEIESLLDEWGYQFTTEGSGMSFLQLLTVLRTIREQKLIQNARTTGRHILDRLHQLEATIPDDACKDAIAAYKKAHKVLPKSFNVTKP
jgi:4-aminobutyrate aminotransferase-like enzyme